MRPMQMLGLALVILGVLALAYGGFTYTKETHDVSLGPIELEVQEKERVNVPLWAGIAAAVGGAGLLAFGRQKA